MPQRPTGTSCVRTRRLTHSPRVSPTFHGHLRLSIPAACAAQQGDATETEETCTQYNMLKIARYLFRWTGAPALADYYERAILNGLIGTQRMSPKYRAHAYVADVAAQPGPGVLRLPQGDVAGGHPAGRSMLQAG